jgi:predicted transcriptional regulator YdeE
MAINGIRANNPEIKEFGPYRLIGMNYRGKNGNREIPQMWCDKFLPRMDEVARPREHRYAFGVERCIPGANDGSFEYIAAAETTEDAAVPDGMMGMTIPRCLCAIFKVADLAGIGNAWSDAQAWFASNREWERYCDPANGPCECHGFELYPPEFDGNGPLYLYFPARRKDSRQP